VIIINYVGRKTLMVVFGFFMAVGMYMLGVGMLIDIKFMQIAGIFIFIFSFQMSWGPIIWLYNAEIMQDKSFSIANICNWVVNCTLSVTIPFVQQYFQKHDPSKVGYIFLVCGTIMVFASLFAKIFMKETRNKTP